jgi:hypothetical protein
MHLLLLDLLFKRATQTTQFAQGAGAEETCNVEICIILCFKWALASWMGSSLTKVTYSTDEDRRRLMANGQLAHGGMYREV